MPQKVATMRSCTATPTSSSDSKTFSPLAELFTEHTAPELLYLESRWASLISFGMTTALLRDVLPVADTTNPETVRQHLHKVATRQDAELGTGQPGLRNDGPADGQLSSVQREAVIVGIDGGYLRNWHDKRKKFEVIVGKSMAENRDDRYFGLVRSQDAAPKHRFCEVLRRQGLPVDREIISTAFVGSTVNLVVSKRFAKRHQMQWSKKGDHRLLQTQTRTPDGTLRDLFTTWYPAMSANDVQPLPLAAAA